MDNVEKVDVQDVLYLFKQRIDNVYSQLPPILQVTSPDSDITVTNGAVTLSPASVDGNVYSYTLTDYGNWTASGTYKSVTVYVDSCKIYTADILPKRYGYRISKNESDPYESVEYLYDAVGMTPAKMNFSTGVFEYGDWADVWFVKDNKPCMLKSDGSVDYYLNPNDYSLRENGGTSDVANSSYDGNAMAQIPLCWVYRYEDADYYYEIISDKKIDENYKAYAHTRADGSIADYFYFSLFAASGSASKLRSLKGQTVAGSITTYQMVQGATANGSGWNIQYWSGHELIRTLLVLISKSLDFYTAFGKGPSRSSSSTSGFVSTGTISDKGQFFGYNSSAQAKVFHIEELWGNQSKICTGLNNVSGKVYAKMTPEGAGYQVDTVNGYSDTGISTSTAFDGFTTKMSCSDYGMIPIAVGGSTSTYFCARGAIGTSAIGVLFVSGTDHSSGPCQVLVGLISPSYQSWNYGCAISFV